MSRALNKVMLIGNVGNEPEIRTTGGGTKVAKFSLATGRQWTDRAGQKQEKTEWHRITAWDRVAEIIEQYVHKGDRLYIEGSIEYSQTEDDQGKPRYWTDIVVREMLMLASPGGSGGGEGGYAPRPQQQQARGPAPAGRGGARRPAAQQPDFEVPGGEPGSFGKPSPFDEDDDDLPF